MLKSTVPYVALAATTLASIWLWIQWRDEQAANQDLLARVTLLERRHEPAAVPVEVAAAAPATAVPAARAMNLELTPDVPPPASDPNYFRDSRQRLLKNPEYRRALLARQRLGVEAELRDLPKYLNLSPEMADRLFDLLAEQEVEKIELQGGWPANRQADQTLPTMTSELRARQEAELSRLIGERNLAQLKEYNSTLESRLEVDQLRAELARTSEPLREDQLEPMLALVTAENQRADQELRDRSGSQAAPPPGFSPANPELAVAANKRIVEAAAVVLSSEQLAAVKDFYRRQRIQMETQSDLTRLQSEAYSRKPN